VFGDAQALAADSYLIQTEESTYTLSVHEERGKKFALMRGEPGTDREHVSVRDNDPRVGDRSLFELHYTEWIGKSLHVASMTTSTILGATRLVLGAPHEARQPLVRVVPPGMGETPRIVPMPSKGTAINDAQMRQAQSAFANTPQAKAAAAAAEQAAKHAREMAQRLVAAGEAPAALPYPDRHVRYAEDVATLLRSIHRRDQLFEDVAQNRDLRERLMNSLDAAEKLLAEIKARAQKKR